MMTTSTALAEIALIQKTAEEIRNDQRQRFPEAASPGDSWRQGDVYITLLGAVPADAVVVAEPALQLVPGSTQGSRHCLDSMAGVIQYHVPGANELFGPILQCEQERTITHPEHGDVTVMPGVYSITYQRNLDQEERQRRVLD